MRLATMFHIWLRALLAGSSGLTVLAEDVPWNRGCKGDVALMLAGGWREAVQQDSVLQRVGKKSRPSWPCCSVIASLLPAGATLPPLGCFCPHSGLPTGWEGPVCAWEAFSDKSLEARRSHQTLHCCLCNSAS